MKITVASGKGGTGKTLVSLALAETAGRSVRLVDCDVEMPNDNLFLGFEDMDRRDVFLPVPRLVEERCTGCGACAPACRYNAIAMAKARPLVFPELCHGCGACLNACRADALEEEERVIGQLAWTRRGELTFVEGRLTVGEHSATPIIRAALAQERVEDELCIVDGPPGTACPFVTAVKGSDLVLLVTEATPFGLHDLEIAVETLRVMDLPFAVISNRSDMGDGRVRRFCRREYIEILLELPHERAIAEGSARGLPALECMPAWRERFVGVHDRIRRSLAHAS